MELVFVAFLALFFLASPVILLIWQLITRERIIKLERAVNALREQVEGRAETPGVAPSPADTAGESVSPEPTPAPPEAVADAASTGASEGVAAEAPVAHAETPVARAEAPAARVEAPLTARAAKANADHLPRPARTNADWEELIGGSLLNKIGVVVLVIGIALLLGYSMNYLGPAGKIAVGLAVSAAMLAGGAVLEARERYRIVARGLIGGGWAGLYFTTFAMHGIEASRIVDSPVVGTALLLAVAVGMVAHSMTYRSETVTGLAYFVTFITLAITPASRFALFASLPAAASLLLIGRRFKWAQMTVAGVVFTYGAYIVRVMSPGVSAEGDFVFGISLLCAYWVMFELFDLMSIGSRQSGIADTLFPINAVGFLLSGILVWDQARPESLWVLFSIAAAGYAASALARVVLLGTARGDETSTASRLQGGGYEGAALLASFLVTLAIGERLDGWQEKVAWLLQAELIILSGLTLRLPFLRHLGSALLVVPVVGVLFEEIPSLGSFDAWGRSWHRATPTALLTAGILYLNRGLIRRTPGINAGGLEYGYNWIGTLLIAFVLAFELPEMWFGPAWLGFGLLLIAYSRGQAASEVFVQGYLLAAAAWLVALFINIPSSSMVWGLQARWLTALPMVPVFYGLAYLHRQRLVGLARSPGNDPSSDGEHPTGRLLGIAGLADKLDLGTAVTMAFAATFLTSWFLLFEVPGRWLTVAWGLQGVALLAAGIAMSARGMRFSGLALLVICVVKVFFYDLNELETIFRIASFIILGTLLIAVSFAYSRYREQIRRLL